MTHNWLASVPLEWSDDYLQSRFTPDMDLSGWPLRKPKVVMTGPLLTLK